MPSGPLAGILNPTLGDNGGLTRTHALVAGSPAADAVPAGNCVTTTDQRGASRPQDGDGNTVPDCDIGAFELGTQPAVAVAANPNPQARCTASRCNIRHQVQSRPGLGGSVYRPDRLLREPKRCPVQRAGIDEGARADPVRRRHYQHPAGETANARLRLTKQGKKIVRTSTRKRLRGVMEIRNSAGLVSSTRIRIRLK